MLEPGQGGAALTAGPDTHPNPARRWIATVAQGGGQLALGLGAGLATALVLLSPPVLVIAVAGLALIPALGASLASAVTEPAGREAAVVTFVVTASGMSIVGIGSAFWGLLAGVLALLLRRGGWRRPAPAAFDDAPPDEPPDEALSDGDQVESGRASSTGSHTRIVDGPRSAHSW